VLDEGVVVVPEDFGVDAVSGIFGGLPAPGANSGLVAGALEAFGVGIAPGVPGVDVAGVVTEGIAAAGTWATLRVTDRGLWAPSLLSAA